MDLNDADASNACRYGYTSASAIDLVQNMSRQHQSNPHPAIKGYLVLYNFIQAVGWTLCLFQVAKAAYDGASHQLTFLAGSPYASRLNHCAQDPSVSCSHENAEPLFTHPDYIS